MNLHLLHHGRHTPPDSDGMGPDGCICHEAFPFWGRIPCYLAYLHMHHFRDRRPSTRHEDMGWIDRWHYQQINSIVWVPAGQEPPATTDCGKTGWFSRFDYSHLQGLGPKNCICTELGGWRRIAACHLDWWQAHIFPKGREMKWLSDWHARGIDGFTFQLMPPDQWKKD